MNKLAGVRVFLQEVSTRDGFQIEPQFIPTDRKVALINALARTGVTKIEVTSFSSPKAIPGLADAEAVMRQIDRIAGVEYAALIPNIRGCERAIAAGVDEVNAVMSASDTHNRANLRLTREQSLAQIAQIVRLTDSHIHLNVSLATAFGCPFDGAIDDGQIIDWVGRLVDAGVGRISLCDTTGVANPAQVTRIFDEIISRWPAIQFAAHLHNTRGMGLANAIAALQAGVRKFDAALGGLGGCPFAPGASGNVCTEDLVHMFDAIGCDTGVDLPVLLELSRMLPGLVGHEVPGQVAKAGLWNRRYPKPEWLASNEPQRFMADTDGH